MGTTATLTIPVRERRIRVVERFYGDKRYIVQTRDTAGRFRSDNRSYQHRTSAKARLGELVLEDIKNHKGSK